MAKQTKIEKFESVEVIQWAFSHHTTNGNGVYTFKIVADGQTITGKTAPGLNQGISRNPSRLYGVQINSTPSGMVRMVVAYNNPIN